MSLIRFPSHVSRSIQFRNVLLSLILTRHVAFSSFLVKLTTPFDKIDLVLPVLLKFVVL